MTTIVCLIIASQKGDENEHSLYCSEIFELKLGIVISIINSYDHLADLNSD